MSPEQIEELRIDLAGGTPRPWRYSPQKMVVETDAEFICDMGLYPPSQSNETGQADLNGELVVNAVNSVERLLDERRALIEALKAVHEKLNETDFSFCHDRSVERAVSLVSDITDNALALALALAEKPLEES